MKLSLRISWILSCVLIGVGMGLPLASASPVVIDDVPAYEWYHGCGPTAAASIIGYWDLHGYPNLFTASGWDQVKLTVNVQDQISSPEHNARYDPTPDDSTKPQSWNSIADWFQTSEDPLPFGSSYQKYAADAFIGYAQYRGYEFLSSYQSYMTFSWSDLTSEIDSGRPMMFLVDTEGNGETDHFVPVLGYDDRGAQGKWYGLYTTWEEDEKVEWKLFRLMGSDSPSWAIGYATFVNPISTPVPAPSALLLFSSGLIWLVRFRRKA